MASEKTDEAEILVTERRLLSALNNLPPIPDLSKHFSSRNAKITATAVVIGFIIYHSVLLGTLGKLTTKYYTSKQ